MKAKWVAVVGPSLDSSDGTGMADFISGTISDAVACGVKVYGPYKVQHHRGYWFRAFRFESETKKALIGLKLYPTKVEPEATRFGTFEDQRVKEALQQSPFLTDAIVLITRLTRADVRAALRELLK